jgi:hypothetical protein
MPILPDDYASYNLTGGVATQKHLLALQVLEQLTTVPSGKIASGQAFFAKYCGW